MHEYAQKKHQKLCLLFIIAFIKQLHHNNKKKILGTQFKTSQPPFFFFNKIVPDIIKRSYSVLIGLVTC